MLIQTLYSAFLNPAYRSVRCVVLAGLLFSAVLTGCVDLNFDEPPITGLPDLEANTTIAELKALHTLGTDDQLIDTDIIIQGVVIADDRSGNFFKSILIQDETAGIELRLNSVGLYNTFPINREVFVRCKGLYIGDYNGVVQLNGSPDAALEEALIADHVLGGARDQTRKADTVTIDQLDAARVSTLIHLKEVQFAAADTAAAYADPVGRLSVNRTVQDCNGNTIILRTSGYADFAGSLTPGRRGSLTAVYSVFGATKQLYIRDLHDVAFSQPRCNQTGGGGDAEPISVQAVRDLFSGGATKAPDRKKIKGVVISDVANGNTDSRNLVLQDGAAGIVVRFRTAHTFALGREVEVDISGQSLTEFRGLLQVDLVDNARAVDLGAGTLPEPRKATLADINANRDAWESTLVKVERAQLSGSATTWGGSITAGDGSGSIVVFTRNTATFAAELYPDKPVDMVGILSQFDNAQLVLRNLNDVSLSTGVNNGPVTELNEPFSSLADNAVITLPGWMNIAVKGTRTWQAKVFGGNVYAQATAFDDTNAEMEAWLISPPIKLESPRVLQFRSSQAFYKHDGLSVWISKDFTGDNFAAATWSPLPGRIATDADGQNNWVDSGIIDLKEFSGIVYIGFRYAGNSSTLTTTYRIDDVKVRQP